MISFQQVEDMLERVLGATPQPFHIAFWRGLTRDAMVAKTIFGKRLVVPGKPEESHMLLALRDKPAGPLRAYLGASSADKSDLALLEAWIREGCPDLPAVPRAALRAEAADERHTEYWRAIDYFFQPSLASQETLPHVLRMHGDALEAWLPTMLSGDPNAWPVYLARPDVAESFAYVRHHQRRLLLEYYNGTQEGIFDSLWKFGGSLLPTDPQHPLPPLQDHRMNSVLDWFFWVPYLDASLRAPDAEDIDIDLARGWELGIVADGLLRTDSERPARDRMPIPDFHANDPDLRAKVEARYVGAQGPELIGEMVRRARESTLFS
jgi:hypothetical protein